jgi:hypothetical protein
MFTVPDPDHAVPLPQHLTGCFPAAGVSYTGSNSPALLSTARGHHRPPQISFLAANSYRNGTGSASPMLAYTGPND